MKSSISFSLQNEAYPGRFWAQLTVLVIILSTE
jgi:hypothetical protein